MVSGIVYLEQVRYKHRDLVAQNIVVGKNNQVKVADFHNYFYFY